MADQDISLGVDLSDDHRATSSSLSVARRPSGMKMTVKTTSVLAPHVKPVSAARPTLSPNSDSNEPSSKRRRSDTNGLDINESNASGPMNSADSEKPASSSSAKTDDAHSSPRGSFAGDSVSLDDSERVVIVGTYRSAVCSNRFRDPSGSGRPNGSSYGNTNGSMNGNISSHVGELLSSVLGQSASGSGELIESCESCQLPISVFGRFLPCFHAPCYECARRALESTRECAACRVSVDDVMQLLVGTLLVCEVTNCRKTFLTARDLRAHADEVHRDVGKETQERNWASNGWGQWHKLQNGAPGRPAGPPFGCSSPFAFRDELQPHFLVPHQYGTQNYIGMPDGVIAPNFDDSYMQFEPMAMPGAFDVVPYRMNGRGPPGPFSAFPSLRPPRPGPPGPGAYLSPPLAQRRPLLPSPPMNVPVAPQMHPSFPLRPVPPFELPPDPSGPVPYGQPFIAPHGYLSTPNGSSQPNMWSSPNLNMSHNLP